MRLNKFLSHHGICSRRDADLLIQSGRVRVNESIQTEPYIVQENDVITVDHVSIHQKPQTQLWGYYKPVGRITTHKDEHNRPTVFNDPRVQKLGHVLSIGRLDLNSEGLLLLTNDPSLKEKLEKGREPRVYKVRVYGDIPQDLVSSVKSGITLEGTHYKSIDVDLGIVPREKHHSRNHWITVTLYEGKNREIRRVMNAFGLSVNRLIRLSYGSYKLDDMIPGELKPFSLKE